MALTLQVDSVRTGYTVGQPVVVKLGGTPHAAAPSTVGRVAFQVSVAPCKSKGQTQEDKSGFCQQRKEILGFVLNLIFKCVFLHSLLWFSYYNFFHFLEVLKLILLLVW